jgi:LysM repeat protein
MLPLKVGKRTPLTKVLLTALVTAAALLLAIHDRSHAQLIDEEGVDYKNISSCTGLLGFYTSLGGNISHPLAAFDSSSNYFAYIKEDSKIPFSPSRVIVTKYDGESCTMPTEVSTNLSNFSNPFHAGPTALVDGNGYVYVTNHAKILEVEKTDNLASAGVMIRESDAAESKHAYMGLRAGYDWGTFKYRSVADDITSNTLTAIGVKTPYWVKLKRTGDVMEGFVSADGESWALVDSTSISMSSKVLVGLAVLSRDNETLNTSTFSQVTVSSEAAIGDATEFQIYTVKAGDTLSGIARMHNTVWRKLQEINELANPHLILPNQRIKVPVQR